MSSLNNVVLVGRAGGDPTIRNLQNAKLANISIAVDRPTKEKATDWFDVQIWGQLADVAEKYLKKGNQFAVIGSLKVEKWEKDGQKHQKVVVVANQLRLMQSKSSGSGGGDSSQDAGGDVDFFSGDGGVNLG